MSVTTRRTLLKGGLFGTAAALAGTVGYGVAYERHQLSVTRVDLPVSALPPELDGLRVGFLTDIHHSETVPAEDVSHAVQTLMDERPDLIVLGGDYGTWGDRQFVGPVAELLTPLTAPHGVFAVLGNHDDDRDLPAALAARHITVLRDTRTRLSIRGASIDVAGVRFWTRRPEDIARVVRGARGPLMLLAHDPRRLTEAAALGVPLVLSGHTHGGQVVLPGLGAVARRNFPVLSGVGGQGSTSLFVSRGVGTVYVPIRLNCPPEVAVLTLRRAPTRG